MMQLIFFAVSLLVLLFGHFLTWMAIVRFLDFNTFDARVNVALFVIFLFVSIILSSYLIHKKDNLLTRWYYIISASWVGVVVNFGLMILVVMFIKSVGGVLNFSLASNQTILILIVGVIGLSLFGFFNAFFPRIKEYKIKIKDLPLAWHGRAIVQISDVHLGPVYRKHFFYRVINRINKLEPEAVFITGDLFDGMESDFSWMNHPFSRLITKKGIYYSYGNHDLYLGFNHVYNLLKGGPVVILDNKMSVVDGLQIIGINYSFSRDFDLYQEILRQAGYDDAKPSILLYHEPKNVQLAVKAGIDLQLSGHTHRGQLFPFNLLAKLFYKGHDYGLFKINDFNLVVNGGLGTWGPPMRTTSRSEIVKITLYPL